MEQIKNKRKRGAREDLWRQNRRPADQASGLLVRARSPRASFLNVQGLQSVSWDAGAPVSLVSDSLPWRFCFSCWSRPWGVRSRPGLSASHPGAPSLAGALPVWVRRKPCSQPAAAALQARMETSLLRLCFETHDTGSAFSKNESAGLNGGCFLRSCHN